MTSGILGVEGYNLFNENARYARFAPMLKPDLAVVVILFNDLLPRSADLRVTSVGTLAAKGRTAPYPDRWRPQLEASALFTALIRTYSMIGQGQSSFDPWQFYPTMELELDRFLVTSRKLGVQVVLTLMSGRSPGAEDYQKLASRLAAYAQLRGISFLGLGNILSESGRHEFFLPNDFGPPKCRGPPPDCRGVGVIDPVKPAVWCSKRLAEAYPKRRYWQGRSFAARRVIQPECPPRILCLCLYPCAVLAGFAHLSLR